MSPTNTLQLWFHILLCNAILHIMNISAAIWITRGQLNSSKSRFSFPFLISKLLFTLFISDDGIVFMGGLNFVPIFPDHHSCSDGQISRKNARILSHLWGSRPSLSTENSTFIWSRSAGSPTTGFGDDRVQILYVSHDKFFWYLSDCSGMVRL